MSHYFPYCDEDQRADREILAELRWTQRSCDLTPCSSTYLPAFCCLGQCYRHCKAAFALNHVFPVCYGSKCAVQSGLQLLVETDLLESAVSVKCDWSPVVEQRSPSCSLFLHGISHVLVSHSLMMTCHAFAPVVITNQYIRRRCNYCSCVTKILQKCHLWPGHKLCSVWFIVPPRRF